jgi:hypothetical protein
MLLKTNVEWRCQQFLKVLDNVPIGYRYQSRHNPAHIACSIYVSAYINTGVNEFEQMAIKAEIFE